MCGIAGWADYNKDLTQQIHILKRMGATLACRGPDDEGVYSAAHAAFAHRRLSVVDPAGGAQPMIRENARGRFVIVYNGELYNTPDLRRDLLTKGYRFRGHSDTEVLLTAYMEWGEECVTRLNGIFAFALWSEASETLFMARDRLGVKPLFYAKRHGWLIFGSELKTLLAHPSVEPRVGIEGLAEVFVIAPARTPGHGVYEGVMELKPGHRLFFDRKGTHVSKYWSLVSVPHEDDLEATTSTLRYLLEDTISRQLVADVLVCTLLSGGLDSSAVTAFAANEFSKSGLPPLRTFEVDYSQNSEHFKPDDFQPDPDSSWARRVSKVLGTSHHVATLDSESLAAALSDATIARDLPGMADMDTSLYLFCKQVKQNATVALSVSVRMRSSAATRGSGAKTIS